MVKTHRLTTLLPVLLLLVAAPEGLDAQGAGGSDAPTARDGIYTQAQANRGKEVYEVECALCHGPREFTGTAFLRRWSNMPVGSLFVHIQNTMPQSAPGILTPRQTADVVAYVLSLNGFPAGNTELPSAPEELSRIRFERPSSGDR